MLFKRLTTQEEIDELIEWHNRNSEYVVLDTETTDKDPRKAKLLDVQLNGKEKDSAVIFSGKFANTLERIDKKLYLIAHNYKYDAHVLFKHTIVLLKHTWRDTLLIGHLLDENRESYSLDSYVKEYWNDPYKEEFWKKYKTYEEASDADAISYACRDIVYTERLFTSFRDNLKHDEIPDSLIDHVHRLQSSLLQTEIEGICIDKYYIQDLGVKIKRQIDELNPRMRSLVADEIETIELETWLKEINKRKTDKGRQRVARPTYSFESPKQLSTLLYDSLQLPIQRNEKTKEVSTDYGSLERIKKEHPIVKLIQENRDIQKVYGTYIQGTIERIEYDRESTPRIYPQFRVGGTVTGRISHNSPNLAQLPKSGGVRGIYVPSRGRVFISADYSQLEVILEANLTADKSLIRMLENGESKHDVTARELGCDRAMAKTLNFALQYWCSAHKVAKLLNCGINEGTRVWNKYWEVYSGSKRLKAQTDKMVDDGVSLQTTFGRKRRFAVKKRQEWDSDYRQAYNFLIQGTGADITSKAFYQIGQDLEDFNQGRALFSVHDEILIECNEKTWEASETHLINYMVGVGTDLGLKIPLKVESSGKMLRWED